MPSPNGRSIIGFAWVLPHNMYMLYIYIYIIIYLLIYIYLYLYIYTINHTIGLDWKGKTAVQCSPKKNGGPHTRFKSRKEQDIQCQT